jgi:hypothetical protein
MTKNKYNGWTNYETWSYKLWLDNDYNTYNSIIELAKEHENSYDLSCALSDLAITNAPEIHSGFYSDVMYSSIKEVNFLEIAESYLEEVREVA